MFLHTRVSCNVFFSVCWCAEGLCEKVTKSYSSTVVGQVIHSCVRSRTWIQLLWIKSRGTRLCVYQSELLDKRQIHCLNITEEGFGITRLGWQGLLWGSYKGSNLTNWNTRVRCTVWDSRGLVNEGDGSTWMVSSRRRDRLCLWVDWHRFLVSVSQSLCNWDLIWEK